MNTTHAQEHFVERKHLVFLQFNCIAYLPFQIRNDILHIKEYLVSHLVYFCTCVHNFTLIIRLHYIFDLQNYKITDLIIIFIVILPVI